MIDYEAPHVETTWICRAVLTVTNTMSVPCSAFSMEALLSLAALCKHSVQLISRKQNSDTHAAATGRNCVSAVIQHVSIVTSMQGKAYCSNLWVATRTQSSCKLFTNLKPHLWPDRRTCKCLWQAHRSTPHNFATGLCWPNQCCH